MVWVFPENNEKIHIRLFICFPPCDGAKEDNPVHGKLGNKLVSRRLQRIKNVLR